MGEYHSFGEVELTKPSSPSRPSLETNSASHPRRGLLQLCRAVLVPDRTAPTTIQREQNPDGTEQAPALHPGRGLKHPPSHHASADAVAWLRRSGSFLSGLCALSGSMPFDASAITGLEVRATSNKPRWKKNNPAPIARRGAWKGSRRKAAPTVRRRITSASRRP